jgi:predicted DNA-binding ribbon-helix-helix protein
MTMETMTEITQAEAERRDRARRYEAALNEKTSSQKTITRMQTRADGYAKQVTLLTAMLEQAASIDHRIDVSVTQLVATIAGSAKGNVIAILRKACADQQRRLDDTNRNLATAREALERAEQVIAELS